MRGEWLNVLNVIHQLKYLYLNGMGKAYEAIGWIAKVRHLNYVFKKLLRRKC